MVYREGEAYEVEFVAADGETIAVETLGSGQVERMSGRRILHAHDVLPIPLDQRRLRRQE